MPEQQSLASLHEPSFSAGMVIAVQGQPEIHYTFQEEVPKEVMDDYQKVVGNGLARVTVSTDMGIKDFGTGASAMVSVSLTCNQDSGTIAMAVQLAGNAARFYALQNRQAAEQELLGIIAQRKQVEAGSLTRPNYG